MTAPTKHSRRDVLKKSAVAGAVFWSVPVIESVTARAAAQSNCFNGSVPTASYVWVVYKVVQGNTTNYYFTGITVNGQFGQGKSDSFPCGASSKCNGFFFTNPGFNGSNVATSHITWGTSCATSDQTNSANYLEDGSPYLNVQVTSTGSGGANFNITTVANSGTSILMIFYFTGGGNGGPGWVCNTTNQPTCFSGG